MLSKRTLLLLSLPLSAAAVVVVLQTAQSTPQPTPQQPAPQQEAPKLDVPFVPSPNGVVDKMLDLAKVGPTDVVYDLGSGDGRIAIRAAQRGARAVGIDIDPDRIRDARANALRANVEDRTEFRQGDLFKVDLSPATVITMYLLPSVNLKLKSKLMQLEPGTRIVSHSFDLGDWKPDQTAEVEGRKIYLWIVPKGPKGGRGSR